MPEKGWESLTVNQKIAAVEKRAQQLCERDGYVWDINFNPMVRGAKISGQPPLTDEQREEYLARARAELGK